jgi:hypothetical protein
MLLAELQRKGFFFNEIQGTFMGINRCRRYNKSYGKIAYAICVCGSAARDFTGCARLEFPAWGTEHSTSNNFPDRNAAADTRGICAFDRIIGRKVMF